MIAVAVSLPRQQLFQQITRRYCVKWKAQMERTVCDSRVPFCVANGETDAVLPAGRL